MDALKGFLMKLLIQTVQVFRKSWALPFSCGGAFCCSIMHGSSIGVFGKAGRL
jgi:hypothetical protein